jgi:hypothetical protein
MTDHTDPLWGRKYAHTLPPPEAYLVRPPRSERVNTLDNNNYRIFFYGWNNVTDYEIE